MFALLLPAEQEASFKKNQQLAWPIQHASIRPPAHLQ
jgi:hypothetical protein